MYVSLVYDGNALKYYCELTPENSDEYYDDGGVVDNDNDIIDLLQYEKSENITCFLVLQLVL